MYLNSQPTPENHTEEEKKIWAITPNPTPVSNSKKRKLGETDKT